MKRTIRIPQAPTEPLPALAEFLAPFRVHFTRSEGPQALERYLTGLLTEHPNKNCDTLPEVVPETNQQQFNHLLTEMVWDESSLNRQRIARMRTIRSEPTAERAPTAVPPVAVQSTPPQSEEPLQQPPTTTSPAPPTVTVTLPALPDAPPLPQPPQLPPVPQVTQAPSPPPQTPALPALP